MLETYITIAALPITSVRVSSILLLRSDKKKKLKLAAGKKRALLRNANSAYFNGKGKASKDEALESRSPFA
jgi:hypothetical protein